jgi:hypothetical protein
VAFGIGGFNGIGHGLPDFSSADTYAQFLGREAAYLGHLGAINSFAGWRDHLGQALAQHPWAVVSALVVTILAVTAFTLAWRRMPEARDRRALLFFLPVWFIVTTAPLMVTYFSARHLYPTTAGLVIGLVLVLQRVFTRALHFIVVSVLLGLVALGQLWSALRPWHDAAVLSGNVAMEVSLTAERAQVGDTLLIDVPPLLGTTAFCWSWATPYSVRPPFTRKALDERLRIVVADPQLSAFWNEWSPPSLSAEHDLWLIRATRDGQIVRAQLPAARVQAIQAQLDAQKLKRFPRWTRFLESVP